MVVDVITYNGEADLFELRYNILKDFVDKFIVIEFDKTFNGRPKEASFLFDKRRQIMYPKVRYWLVSEDVWSKYIPLAKESPNTVGAEHWITEFAQKESIKDYLTDLNDEDIVFIGDCDEIWDPQMLPPPDFDVWKLRLRVYTYYLNNLSSESFLGTLVGKYKYIKDKCLNHLRTFDNSKTTEFYGWHFTSMKDGLKQKLEDSYTPESYATPEVLDNLLDNINNNKDFLGRDFKYTVDESQWPQYLKDNRERYAHLLKPVAEII